MNTNNNKQLTLIYFESITFYKSVILVFENNNVNAITFSNDSQSTIYKINS